MIFGSVTKRTVNFRKGIVVLNVKLEQVSKLPILLLSRVFWVPEVLSRHFFRVHGFVRSRGPAERPTASGEATSEKVGNMTEMRAREMPLVPMVPI